MKNPDALNGSGAALTAVALMQAAASFLLARQQVIRLSKVGPPDNGGGGYIWRRVFLKNGEGKPR